MLSGLLTNSMHTAALLRTSDLRCRQLLQRLLHEGCYKNGRIPGLVTELGNQTWAGYQLV